MEMSVCKSDRTSTFEMIVPVAAEQREISAFSRQETE